MFTKIRLYTIVYHIFSIILNRIKRQAKREIEGKKERKFDIYIDLFLLFIFFIAVLLILYHYKMII